MSQVPQSSSNYRSENMAVTMFEDVATFHKEILDVPDSAPHMLSDSEMHNRVMFLQEELLELGVAHTEGNIVGAADALADLIYVALGTAHMMGLPMNSIWRAVQRANMAKVRGFTKRGMAIDATKPKGWVGPETAIEVAIKSAMEAAA